MAKPVSIIPRRCVMWCNDGKKKIDTIHPLEVALDLTLSIVSTQVVCTAVSVKDMVLKAKQAAGVAPFCRLIIKGEGANKDSKGNPLVGISIGTDFVTAGNFALHEAEFAKLDDALDDDAEVEIIDCFTASDPALHRKLAKAIGHTVKAGVGLTDFNGFTNDGGWKRCTKNGVITNA